MWVICVLHERFHQWQMNHAGYTANVNKLGLSEQENDTSWMLNYPFPYDNSGVAKQFARVSRLLHTALVTRRVTDAARFWTDYASFLSSLQTRDRRYLEFQLWQEGVSRYVELRVAQLAAES